MLKIKKLALLGIILTTYQLSASLNGQLLNAANLGDTETVQELPNQDADVNATNNDGSTALMLAVITSRTEIVEFLKNYRELQQQVSVGDSSHKILEAVLRYDYAELLRRLLSITIVNNIYTNNELVSLIKSGGFVERLLNEYKETLRTLQLLRRAEEPNNPWVNIPTEITNMITQYVFQSNYYLDNIRQE